MVLRCCCEPIEFTHELSSVAIPQARTQRHKLKTLNKINEIYKYLQALRSVAMIRDTGAQFHNFSTIYLKRNKDNTWALCSGPVLPAHRANKYSSMHCISY
jgi:hypothetical protein